MWDDKVLFSILVSSCFVVNCQAQSYDSDTIASTNREFSESTRNPICHLLKPSEEEYKKLRSFYKQPAGEICTNPYFPYREPWQEEYEDPHSFSQKPSQEQYEDPHSFHPKPAEETTGLVQKIGNYIGYDDICKCNCDSCEEELRLCNRNIRNKPGNTDVADVLLSRRLVNTILSRAKFVEDGETLSSHLKLQLTHQELHQLREFGKGKLTLRQIDPVLNNAIKTHTEDPVVQAFEFLVYLVSVLYSTSLWLFLFTMEHMEIVAAIPLGLYIISVLNNKKYGLYMLLTVGITVIFIVSFITTWRKLIQEAEIKHSTLQMQYLDLPEHCRPDATLWTSIRTFFRSSDDCKNYHTARMKTPSLDVTPAQALSHMLSHVLYEPIAIMGKAIAAFLQHVTADMSPFLAGVVQIVICVSCLPILIVSLILLAGGSLRLGGLGPLSFLSLSGANKTNTERIRGVDRTIERQPLEIILKLESHERYAGNVSIGDPDNSRTLPIMNESQKTKSKRKVIASTLEPMTDETVSGDISSADSSDSEDQSVATETSEKSGSDVKKPPEIGSGDHA